MCCRYFWLAVKVVRTNHGWESTFHCAFFSHNLTDYFVAILLCYKTMSQICNQSVCISLYTNYVVQVGKSKEVETPRQLSLS